MDLRAVLGDITDADVDVVVNAANPGLLGGGGVDGVIHAAGGPSILAECRALKERLPGGRLPRGEGGARNGGGGLPGGRLPRGEAVATTAGRLPARWVVHTAGPIWSATEDRSAVLRSCYAAGCGWPTASAPGRWRSRRSPPGPTAGRWTTPPARRWSACG